MNVQNKTLRVLGTVGGVLFSTGYITYTVLMKKRTAAIIEPEAVEIPELIEAAEQPEPIEET